MIRRKRIMFWLRIFSLFLLGLIVAFVIALSQVNLETLRGNVVSVLQETTGYQVQIDGIVSWKFSLRPRIELNQVRIANAEWAKEKYGFSAERMDVTLDLLSLLCRSPTIRNIKLYDTAIKVETNDDGILSLQQIVKPEIVQNEKTDMTIDKFPIPDSPFGRIELENLLFDNGTYKFFMSGMQLRYEDTDKQREYHGWIKPRDEVYPFIIVLKEYDKANMVYPIRFALSTGGNALIADVTLEAKTKRPVNFVIKGDIVDVRALHDLLNIDLTGLPKISVDVVGGLPDEHTLVLHKSSIVLRGTDINISGVYNWGGKIPSIKANISSNNVNLLKLVPEMYSGWVRPDRELNVFHDMNLHGKDIRNFDLDLDIELKHLIVYRNMDLKNTNIDMTYKNQQGRIDVSVNIAGGKMLVGGDFNIDKTGKIFLKTGVQAKGLSIGKLMDEIKIHDFIVGLPVDIYAYLECNGTNMSEWMSTMTGPVQVYSVADGYAYSQLVENIYGTDVLTSLRHDVQDLFTKDKKHDKVKISCVTANLKLRNGDIQTRNGIAIESNSINARLAGGLNLGEETIKLALTTVPVRGLKLSLTGNVVNTVEIAGNLAEPDIKINGAAVAGKVVSATGLGLLLSPFTGGISIVTGLLAGELLENWLADEHPCQTALVDGAPEEEGDAPWMNFPVADLTSKMIKN